MLFVDPVDKQTDEDLCQTRENHNLCTVKNRVLRGHFAHPKEYRRNKVNFHLLNILFHSFITKQTKDIINNNKLVY